MPEAPVQPGTARDFVRPSAVRRRRRWPRWLALGVVLFAGGLALAYHLVTEPHRLRRLCENRLRRLLDGQVRVEEARFSLLEGLELSGVAIAGFRSGASSSRTPDLESPDIYCRRVQIRHQPRALLLGRFAIEELTASGLMCNLVRDEFTEGYNLGTVFRLPRKRGVRRPGRLPVVRVRDAVFVVAREGGADRREVERVGLSAVATPESDDPPSYMLAWTTTGPDSAAGRSRLNLDTMTFTDIEGGLPWLSLELAMLGADARLSHAVNWFTLLGLSGRIRAQDYSVSMGGGSEPPRVTIRLRDAALSLPIDEVEQSLPPQERYLRFEHVQGRIELCGGIAEAEFTAQLHGSDCRVSATLSGPTSAAKNLGDLGFHVALHCDEFELPSDDPAISAVEARFVRRWRPVRGFFNDFDPRGRVSVNVVISKAAGADQPVRLEWGRIDVSSGDASHRSFPYRVHGLRGYVELDGDGIHIRELQGEHGGAPIHIRGWLREADWETPAELHFRGRRVRLDDELHDAVSPRFRRIWDQFDVSGAADLEVSMTRAEPSGEQSAPWLTTVKATLLEGAARFAGFPYPVSGLSGRVTVTPSRIEVARLSGRNGAAAVSIEGFADLDECGPVEMDLRLDAQGVVFNDELMAALPADSRQTIGAFSPRGVFDLSGEIRYDASAGGVTYDLVARIRDTEATYRDLPATVQDISGRLRIQPHQVLLEGLSGRRGPARIGVSGSFGASAGQVNASVVVRCQDLGIDEELLAALPPGVASVCRDLQLSGSLHTTTYYDRRGPIGAETATQRTVIEPDGVSIQDVRFPLPLSDVRGRLVVEEDRVLIESLRAVRGPGSVGVSGSIVQQGESVAADLALTAERMPLDEDLRQAVPWRLRRLWNDIAPQGAFDVNLDRLRYHRTGAGAPPRWEFAGRLRLDAVDMSLGAQVRQVEGTIAGAGAMSGAPARLDLDAELALNRASIAGKPLEHVRGRVQASAEAASMALRDLHADVCQGRAAGEVRLSYGEDASGYDAAVTLQGVDLAAFLNAGRAEHERLGDVSGVLDAHVYLGSAGADPGARRGGGRVLIRDGQLYRLPLVSTIRSEARVKPRDEAAAQELSGEFFITGPRVELANLVLQGPGLALVGAGDLAPANGGLDLTLVAVSPRQWIKVPLLTEFLEGASRELVEINVRGTLAKPHIATRPLRGVESAIETLFKKQAGTRNSERGTRNEP